MATATLIQKSRDTFWGDEDGCRSCGKTLLEHEGPVRYCPEPIQCTADVGPDRECVYKDGHTGAHATVPTADLPCPICATGDGALTAQRDRLLDVIESLLPLIDAHAFVWPAAQEAVHAARAALAELGRGVPDDRAVIVQAWLEAKERQ